MEKKDERLTGDQGRGAGSPGSPTSPVPERRLTHWANYVKVTLATILLGIVTNVVSAKIDPKWAAPWTLLLLGAIGVGGVIAYVIDRRERNAYLEQRLDTLETTVKKLKQRMDIQVQQRFTHMTLEIEDAAGAEAKITKRVAFRALCDDVDHIREDVHYYDGHCPAPMFSLARYVSAAPMTFIRRDGWETLVAETAMIEERFQQHRMWVVKLGQPLQEGMEYLKTITFRPQNSYTADVEHHGHRFPSEERAVLDFIFNPSYGGGIAATWRRKESLPVAILVRRFQANLNLVVTPESVAGGAVRFRFQIEPEEGDFFKLEWRNPVGRRAAVAPVKSSLAHPGPS